MHDRPAGPLRVAVFASGRGSNLQALLDAARSGRLPIEIVLVASDKAHAPALRRAEHAGITTLALDPHSYAQRADFDAELFARVAAAAPDLIVLAGYLRIIDPDALAPWQGRIINIHPSVLPKFPGLHTHQRALAAGEREHGASVHFVSAQLDGGPLIAQTAIVIDAADNAQTLAQRLLPQEHRLLIACVDLIARDRLVLDGEHVVLDGQPLRAPLRLGATGATLD